MIVFLIYYVLVTTKTEEGVSFFEALAYAFADGDPTLVQVAMSANAVLGGIAAITFCIVILIMLAGIGKSASTFSGRSTEQDVDEVRGFTKYFFFSLVFGIIGIPMHWLLANSRFILRGFRRLT